MTTKNYEEFAVLDAQIKHLTNQKDELKVKILEELVNTEEKSVNLSVGKFTISELKTWTYTDNVTELEEEFKALKAKEQSVGVATFEAKPSLRFTAIKL